MPVEAAQIRQRVAGLCSFRRGSGQHHAQSGCRKSVRHALTPADTNQCRRPLLCFSTRISATFAVSCFQNESMANEECVTLWRYSVALPVPPGLTAVYRVVDF
jgi:hypothetical protein